jgi:hypothetical protein
VNDRLAALESAIDDLRASVRRLEERIALLERRDAERSEPAPGPSQAAPAASAEAAPSAVSGWREPTTLLSQLGRLLIVLGGGYLLRAMTDARILPPGAGVALGLAYGLGWLMLANRAGAKAQLQSAVFHGVGAAAVAFPVVVEATTRFRVLTGQDGAIALTVMTAGLLAVACRRRIQALAWVAAAGAIPASIVVLARTDIVVPHAYFLIAFGVTALWMGYTLDWFLLRWPVAAAADLVVLGVTLRALSAPPRETPGEALALQIALLGAYLASIAVRTLVRGRNVIPFEVVQTLAALAVGLGGALSVTRATGSGAPLLGAACVLLGAASYSVAFAFLDRRGSRTRNVYFYTSLAVVLVLVGVWTLLPAPAIAAVLALLAMACGVAWARSRREFLLLHAAMYIVVAAIASGTIGYSIHALVAGSTPPWPRPTVVMLVIVIASAASAWFAASRGAGDRDRATSVPRFVIVLVLVLSAGGALVGYLAPVVGGRPDGPSDAGLLATIRTGVLAAATLVCAWMGRHARFREWGWLVYPVLIGTGLKMVVQDFARSRPATLFVALALYGVALILAPRMRRQA